MKKIFFIILSMSALLFMACNKYEQEFSPTYPLNGRYLVTEMYKDSSTSAPYEIIVSNTAGNSKYTILISNIYNDGIVAKANVSGTNFSVNLTSDLNPNPVNIYPLINIKNGTVSSDKKTIQFEVNLLKKSLTDTIDHIIIKGKRETGFE